MAHHVDLYYTMRSPYCYLATPQLMSLVAAYDLAFDLKPVYPLAITCRKPFLRPAWMPTS